MRMTEKEYKEFCKKKNIPYISPKFTPKKVQNHLNGFDSLAEENFYKYYVLPRLSSGEIAECKLHPHFTILKSLPQYGLKARTYTPDFFLIYKDSKVRIVEMKGKVVKKLQRDYPLRKHLFIEKFCIPNDWEFKEEISENWTGSNRTFLDF